MRDAAKVEQVSRLRQQAYRQGYDEFRLVVVTPPHQAAVDIDGLDALLFKAVVNDLPQELDSLSSHTRVTEVSNITVSSVAVTAEYVRVTGDGVVEADLDYGGGNERDGLNFDIDFPFTFALVLTRDLHLEEVTSIVVDTSSFSR